MSQKTPQDNHQSKSKKTSQYTLDDLLYLMQRLRKPVTGCPWDLKQDYRSIAPSTLEEAYEVVDAIEKGDYTHLKEELGDLLFQVIFYAQLATEEKRYNFADIIHSLTDKLIRRHPHVFPEGTLHSERLISEGKQDQQQEKQQEKKIRDNWEKIKEQERQDKGQQGLLSDVPLALTALNRAAKLQKRAARVGFDWTNTNDVIAKIREEVVELEEAIANNDTVNIREELGDVIFTCVNLSRHLKVDAEQSLRESNQKFEERIQWIDTELKNQDKTWQDCDESVLDSMWNAAKESLRI